MTNTFTQRAATLLLAAALSMAASVASAATLNFNFTGHINGINTAAFPSAPSIQLNDAFSLALSIDTNSPVSTMPRPTQASYHGAITNLVMTVGGLTYNLGPDTSAAMNLNSVGIVNGASFDSIGVVAPLIGPAQGGLAPAIMQMSFSGMSTLFNSTLLDTAALMGTLPLAVNNTFGVRFLFGSTSRAQVLARLTTNSVSVAAVPLPAAGLLLIGALGGLGMMRRRKKTALTAA